MSPSKKGGLGKGLNALIRDSVQAAEKKPEQKTMGEVIRIDINSIMPNPHQPRKRFDEEKLTELAESIRLHGIIQPIIVQRGENGYEIVAGERRWRASRKAGLKEVPCLIKSISQKDNLLVALIENLQREDLNPIDEAEAYHYMIDTYKLTQEEIAKNVGKSRPYVANSLRLQKLPDPVREMVASGSLSPGHARALISLEDPARQLQLAEAIIKNGLSVRQAEALARESQQKTPPPAQREKSSPFLSIESDIKDILGTKVKIKEKNNKGSIQLSFYSREELERLIELLCSIKNPS